MPEKPVRKISSETRFILMAIIRGLKTTIGVLEKALNEDIIK